MSERALVVDDDPAVRYTLRALLEDTGVQVDEAGSGVEALERFAAAHPDLVITDLRMPKLDGLGLLARLRAIDEAVPVVLITAHGSERHAVEAMRAGAFDYFRKPFEPDELLAVVRRALETSRLRRSNQRLRSEPHLARSMVFASPAMARIAELVERVARHDVNVLITGESGTGKERVAEAIVRASRRKDRPFLRFNSAALTPELAEAELFGHKRGAFTGAHADRAGLFREADGGTILLDEVAELDGRTQAKLLRVLQEGEVRPVGEDHAAVVDVRILAATHRDLEALVAEGRFREDLYYRLKVVHLVVPPLRERPEDIAPLFLHFFRRAEERFGVGPLTVPEGFVERLAGLPWAGNVREMENLVESLVALSANGTIDPAILPASPTTAAATLKERVEAYERGLIVQALRAASGNRSEAARRLGIGRATLHEKLSKYGILDHPE